jgi:hypothetical protein
MHARSTGILLWGGVEVITALFVFVVLAIGDVLGEVLAGGTVRWL